MIKFEGAAVVQEQLSVWLTQVSQANRHLRFFIWSSVTAALLRGAIPATSEALYR